MREYTAVDRIDHNGDIIEPGQNLRLSDADAAQLLESGAIKNPTDYDATHDHPGANPEAPVETVTTELKPEGDEVIVDPEVPVEVTTDNPAPAEEKSAGIFGGIFGGGAKSVGQAPDALTGDEPVNQ